MSCVACQDARRCWVCLGTGLLGGRDGESDCPSCIGSGRCPACGRPDAGSGWPPASVLVVDDDPRIGEAVAAVLRTDPRCREAAAVPSGEAAMGWIAEHDPDVIVCDHQIGLTRSVDYLAGLRSAALGARIYVHTSDPARALSDRVVERGADRVVHKGAVDLVELADLVFGG